MTLSCTLCKLDFNNEDQFKQHLDGKRHKKIQSIKEERENSAKRSLFVSGLKKDTFIKQLEEHFIKFGKINKTVTDNDKNAYAIIEFEEQISVDFALECKEHLVNGKKLKVSRREMKQFISKISSNHEKKKELMNNLKEEAITLNTLMGKCLTFDEQIEKLVEYYKLSDKDTDLRQQIKAKLTDIFSQFWSKDEFNVEIFGSSFTGLACNGSDMDLSILFEQYKIENQLKQLKQPKVVVRQIKNGKNDSNDSQMESEEIEEEVNLEDETEEEEHSLKEDIKTFFNDKKYAEFLTFDVEHQIKILSRIIQRFYYDIKSLKTITNTRCPLVRFHNDKLNINCDLSLNNFLACENSRLLKLYFTLESDLKKTIFVLRYWFRQKNLYSTNKFNSYTIIWMLIFYLQTKKIGFLPILEDLSKITNKVNEIHGWNCAFEDDLTKIKTTFSSQNFVALPKQNDLLKGFFEFYSQFSFDKEIIFTREAKAVLVEKKTELSKISQYINIQDPFDLSHNLTVNIPKSTLERFVLECKGSNELLHYGQDPKRSANKGWGLILLTTKKSLPVFNNNKDLVEKSFINLKIEDPKKIPQNISLRRAIDFVMFLLTDCLLFQKVDPSAIKEKPKKRTRILNQICDKVDSLGLNCSPKRLRTGEASMDVNRPAQTYVCVIDESLNNNCEIEFEDDEAKTLASYYLSVVRNTWQGRRPVKRDLIKNFCDLNDLEIERRTSQKLYENSKDKPVHFKIQFSYSEEFLSETNGKNLSNLNIKFDLLDGEDQTKRQEELINFTTLVHFLDIYINNCQEKLFEQWNAKNN